MSQAGFSSNSLSGAVLTLTGNSGGAVSPGLDGDIDIVGAGYITVTGTPGSNLLTITSSVSLMPWTEITDSTVAMDINNGYVMNKSTLITATLPVTAAVGSVISVVGEGAGKWTIAQNAGQNIRFGDQTTTTGVGGSLAAILQHDCVDLICTVADTSFVVRSSVGNLTVT